MTLASRAEVSGVGTRDEPLRTSAWEASITHQCIRFRNSPSLSLVEKLFLDVQFSNTHLLQGDLVNLILNYVNYLLS